jgi:hypothetical protein
MKTKDKREINIKRIILKATNSKEPPVDRVPRIKNDTNKLNSKVKEK